MRWCQLLSSGRRKAGLTKSALSFGLALNFILMASQVLGAALRFRDRKKVPNMKATLIFTQHALRKMTQNLNFVLHRALHLCLKRNIVGHEAQWGPKTANCGQ